MEPEAQELLTDEEAARLEILCAISACAQELPEEDALLYKLKYVKGAEFKDIAAALGCGVRNIHLRRLPRLSRGSFQPLPAAGRARNGPARRLRRAGRHSTGAPA